MAIPDEVYAAVREVLRRHNGPRKEPPCYYETMDAVARALLEYALEKTKYNGVQAGRVLGLNRNTIYLRMRKLGIPNCWHRDDHVRVAPMHQGEKPKPHVQLRADVADPHFGNATKG